MQTDTTNLEIDDLKQLRIALDHPKDANLSEVLALWRNRTPDAWALDLKRYQELSEFFLKRGEAVGGYDVANAGLYIEENKKDPFLRQRCALALARIGATDRAKEMLLALKNDQEQEGCTDPETLGILGRTYKDLWERNKDTPLWE